MRIIAAGHYVIHTGELDGELQRIEVEIHGIIVKFLFQIRGCQLAEILPELGKCFVDEV